LLSKRNLNEGFFSLKSFILSLEKFGTEEKNFVIKQMLRMPDHYLFGVSLLCFFFRVFRISPKAFSLLDKLISSLAIIKFYEKDQ
tara:strand:- start:131 stop:385 length:255 start_codon:yes stop_codon:yes gene_type:complete